MADIKNVAVIGAGVMGAGIAAQVANAGVPVVLLDILPDGASRAIDRMLKTEPAAFMSRQAARLVTPGNTEDHLALVADCDWIVEAVIERLDVKQALYRKLDAVRKPGAVVSSNTSTIPLATLTEGMSAAFAEDFCVTHFFNPPRYMRLLEVVKGARTRPAVIDVVTRFADVRLGKSVVACKDRPGFIANRLGVFWMDCAVVEAVEQGLDVEDADAILGRPMGIPRTGIFGLMDLVGIDLMPHVIDSLIGLLPPDDAIHRIHRKVPLLDRMVADGHTGRKGKGGFYRLNRSDGSKVMEAISLVSGEYRPQKTSDLPALAATKGDLRALLSIDDPAGRYAWRVLGQTLAYAASLVPEAADDIAAIDEAMRLGYNWSFGPFELIDQIGADWLADKLAQDGWPVPSLLRIAGARKFYRTQGGLHQQLGGDGVYRDVIRPEGEMMLADVKMTGTPLLKNRSAALWDIGDGVACFEFTGKKNALDTDTLSLLGQSLTVVGAEFKALVIYNEDGNFSTGAALEPVLAASGDDVEPLIAEGQQAFRALKAAPFPVVGAPAGQALNGACELLLHCDAVQAYAETSLGLAECSFGLLPAWGGCAEMLHRWLSLGKDPLSAIAKLFEILRSSTIARSAAEAKDLLFLRPSDGITMNRYRLLSDAKAKALKLAERYRPPPPFAVTLPGESARLALLAAAENLHLGGKVTAHDLSVAAVLADVLSGHGLDVSHRLTEDQILGLERTAILGLLRHPATLARIESWIETGRAVRN
jgi:3-hydroxyacyl-CoA dehydrogenase